MRLKVRACQADSFRIRSRQMRSVVCEQIVLDSLVTYHLRQSILAKREDVIRGVGLFLVESSCFDSDGVDEESGQRRTEVGFVRCRFEGGGSARE